MSKPLENSTEIVRRIRSRTQTLQGRKLPAMAQQLVADVVTLDEMLTNGRRLPMQWKSRRVGREPLVEDGTVLSGITHGRRYGYNKGCHCGPCRAANRGESREYINNLLRERGWKELT